MCGIVGIFAKEENGKAMFKNIEKATLSLNKRGPDAQQFQVFENCALGHARLSIIDTSEEANQPLYDASKKFCITFNGEIYNYREIKSELIKKGYQFHTNSDTEVLLNAYIEYGEKCLTLLNGFFAFCILNIEKNEIFIARDRIGIKPLHIYEDEQIIAWASEPKALFALGINKKINVEHQSLFFKLNYLPPKESILVNCRKLPSGNYIKLSSQEKWTSKPYYQLKNSKSNIPYSVAQNQLKELLYNSVEKRMISDVPLGSFLSGGTDSSIIAGIASELNPNINTFSIGYEDEPLFDETEFALAVANQFKTNHHVFKLKNDDLLASYYDMVKYIDEPFADSSAIAVNLLAKYTKEKVTVALSGDGADELFSGYNKHKAEYWLQQKGLKQNVLKHLPNVFSFFPQSRNTTIGNLFRQLDKLSDGMKQSGKDRYWNWASWMDNQTLNEILIEFQPQHLITHKENYTSSYKEGDFNSYLLTDQNLVLQGDMLTKVDLMSMNNSLEVRVPFLDHQLVDFVNSLPVEYKINGELTKKILQETFKDFLPEILFKRKKHGFEVPLLKWFNNELREEVDNLILNKEFIKEQSIFKLEGLKKLVLKNRSNNPGDSTSNIWALLVFQNWYKNYYTND